MKTFPTPPSAWPALSLPACCSLPAHVRKKPEDEDDDPDPGEDHDARQGA